MEQRDDEQIRLQFALRRRRQILASAATFIFLLLLALLDRRPDIFGHLARNDILAAQIVLLGVFIWFSIYNWRCPSCKNNLGPDINRRVCRQCKARLQ
jgi:hypothetical protein